MLGVRTDDPACRTPPTRWRVLWYAGPVVLALFQVAGTIGASHGQPDATGLGPLAIAIAIAGPLSLLLIRRSPQGVLGFVTGISLLYVAVGYPYGPVFAAFAAAVVINIVIGNRALAWCALGAMYAMSTLAQFAWLDKGWSWGWSLGVLAWVLLLAGFGELVRVRQANRFEARRRQAETVRREAGEERLRIARELHDVVAHHMSLINVQAGVALHLVDRKPEQVETSLQTIKDASREALNELRSLIGVLRAEGDDAAPRLPVATLSSLDELATRTRQAGVDLQTRVDGTTGRIPAAIELAAYRIVQEAVTNVVRHSGATRAEVMVKVTRDAVDVTIEDNGRGIDVTATDSEGSGIRGMQERATALGGDVEVRSGRARGTVVRAHLPFEDAP